MGLAGVFIKVCLSLLAWPSHMPFPAGMWVSVKAAYRW